jgi:hypothetical protein
MDLHNVYFFLSMFERLNVNVRITWDTSKHVVVCNKLNSAVFVQILIQRFIVEIFIYICT